MSFIEFKIISGDSVKKILALFVAYVIKLSLKVRYRVTVKGLENLNSQTLNKSGGVLFLPNHPAVFVDPTLIALSIMKEYPIRPLIVEYMYYTPIVHWIAQLMDALPVPNFNIASNSLKRKKSEKVIQQVIKDLQEGSNFLVFPAGKSKHTNKESIGGASGVHRIIQETPDVNVVLVRITGLWGSSFSRALTGTVPPLFKTILQGVKIALKNLIFFTPKRHVTIEFLSAPADFPYKGSRMEVNKYLESWYNRPDSLSDEIEDSPGETLSLVSYSFWKDAFPVVNPPNLPTGEYIDLDLISDEIKEKITKKLANMLEMDPAKIKPEMNISVDLGLDSLDISELAVYLGDQFEVRGIPVHEVTTVGKLMAIAAKQIVFNNESEEEMINLEGWKKPISRYRVNLPEGRTMPEVFLNNCARMGDHIACADARSGIITYPKLKLRVLVLAEYIRNLPGDYIGILLPASVAANVCILACQLAGKTPLLINWTVGPRHLESILKICSPKAILSSWMFLDRLQNADLTPIEDLLIMLEDVQREIGLTDKLKGFFRSKWSSNAILRIFNIHNQTEDSRAVILFTSGTESMPKGVPLSHKNVISNQRDSLEVIELYSDDVFLGVLPPFHAFGFTLTGTLPLLCGLKVAYSPDPTDGKRLAKALEKWGVTVACGAPTFLKAIFKAAHPEQVKTLRYCASGAEKAPPELYQLLTNLGKEGILQEGYGITECSPVLTANRINHPAQGVGRPLRGVELCIVDPDTHRVLSQGERGLILARGPNIFSGYLNPGLMSPFVEVDGKIWYLTGDLGFLDKESNLTLSGRLKRFIKIGAEMISLASIEDALLQEAMEKQWTVSEDGPILAICAKEDEGHRPRIYLFTRFAISIEEVNNALRDAGFSNITRVASVHQLKEIPIMGSGKINYRELEAQYIVKKTEH